MGVTVPQIKKEKNLQKRVESLIRENKQLRKKLGKLRKEAHKSVNSSPKPKKEDVSVGKSKVDKPKVDLSECSYCKGELKKVIVFNLEFEVCQKCKARKRLK